MGGQRSKRGDTPKGPGVPEAVPRGCQVEQKVTGRCRVRRACAWWHDTRAGTRIEDDR